MVADETILVCPENFSNRPVAASLDVRKQLTVLRRQLSRIARIDDLLDLLPPGLTFDLDPDGTGVPHREPRRPGRRDPPGGGQVRAGMPEHLRDVLLLPRRG